MDASCSESETEKRVPYLRNSKACESCRKRKIKCRGGVPCAACRDRGEISGCTVRVKSRTRRSLPTRYLAPRSTILNQVEPKRRRIGTNHSPASAGFAEIERSLALWCSDNGVSLSQLIFRGEKRIHYIHATPIPLPPLCADFENRLMDYMGDSLLIDPLLVMDRPRILSLYNRYRLVPDSLADDQKAYLFSALCLSRFSQIRFQSITGAVPMPCSVEAQHREDVTYYRMATKALADWNRPSILAVWALYCLISYAIAIGGLTEIRDLLEEMAGQIVDLGLHQQAIAAHYSSQDMVLILFSAFTSADTLFAGLMDTEPFLSSDNFDVNPLAIRFVELHQASLDELDYNEFFRKAGSQLLDLQVASRFNMTWYTRLKQIREVHVSDGHMIERSWAQLRYNWLQIRLNSSMLTDPTLVAHAYSHLCRAVSQILNCYTELHDLKQLNTSWPQLQRISTCGQILILCMAAGELHKLEAENLFNKLLCLIAEHRPAWPEAEMLLEGFRHAGRCLQIGFGPPVPLPRQDVGTILCIPHLPVRDLESWGDDFLEVDTSLALSSSSIILPSAFK